MPYRVSSRTPDARIVLSWPAWTWLIVAVIGYFWVLTPVLHLLAGRGSQLDYVVLGVGLAATAGGLTLLLTREELLVSDGHATRRLTILGWVLRETDVKLGTGLFMVAPRPSFLSSADSAPVVLLDGTALKLGAGRLTRSQATLLSDDLNAVLDSLGKAI